MNDQTQPNDTECIGAASELSAGVARMTHYWCQVCDAIRPAFFEGDHNVNVTGKFKGGDIVCEECNFIIATAYRANVVVQGAEAAGITASRRPITRRHNSRKPQQRQEALTTWNLIFHFDRITS